MAKEIEVEIESFHLEEIPRHLQALFVEKMLYEDFEKFNKCSKLSDEICRFKPMKAMLPFKVFRLSVEQDREMVFLKESVQGINLEEVPDYVSLKCEIITLQKLECFDKLQKHVIRTNKITTIHLLQDPIYVKQLLSVTGASRLEANVTPEVISMPELRQMYSLKLTCDEECDEAFIVPLQVKQFTFYGEVSATHATFETMLKQWLDGERKIDKIIVKSTNFDIPTLKMNLEGRFTLCRPSDGPGLFLCRSALHQDCLRILLRGGFVCIVNVKIVADLSCPNFIYFPVYPLNKRSN